MVAYNLFCEDKNYLVMKDLGTDEVREVDVVSSGVFDQLCWCRRGLYYSMESEGSFLVKCYDKQKSKVVLEKSSEDNTYLFLGSCEDGRMLLLFKI